MKLRIAPQLALDDFITSTQVVLAQKGKGKSYLMDVQAEELLEQQQQVVIIDPTGAHHGLRTSADGKRAGYSIAILGGEHADAPLEASAGEVVAEAIATEHFSAIIDLTLFRKGEALRFMAAFLETLYRKNRTALHLFIDEADSIAPQKMFGPEQARTLGAAEDIVRRGRIRGIGCTLATQRPQVLNKDVLTQADMLTTLGMNHPKDLGAIGEWVAVHGDPAKAKVMIESLPSLPRGDAWIWNPTADIFKRVTIREKRTFDSGRTPKSGERKAVAKVLAPVDIQRLGASIAATVERAKENDPKALKVRVADLEKQLLAWKGSSERLTKTKIVEKPILKEAQLARAEKMLARYDALCSRFEESREHDRKELLDMLAKIDGAFTGMRDALRMASTSAVPRTKAEPPNRVVTGPQLSLPPSLLADARAIAAQRRPKMAPEERSIPTRTNGHASIGGGLRRILIALAQRQNGLTNRQIGVRAGLSSHSGTFATYLSRARKEGWIEDVGDVRRITLLGIEALGHYDPLPVGKDLADHWLRELGESGASRILRTVIDAYPDEVDPATIGERAQISSKSGTYATYVSKLRGLELVTGRGSLRAAEELFS